MQAGPSASMRRTSRSADQTAARHRDGVRLVDELAAPYPSWAPVDKLKAATACMVVSRFSAAMPNAKLRPINETTVIGNFMQNCRCS